MSVGILGRRFYAAGDGVTDDWANLMTIVANAPAGDVIHVPGGPGTIYRVTAPLVIPKRLRLAGDGAEIRQATPNTAAIILGASGSRISGFRVTGTAYAAAGPVTTRGISAVGTLAAPLLDIEIDDCETAGWAFYGIFLRYVDGFRVRGCHVDDSWYAGIMGESVRAGRIDHNDVERVVGAPNGYGIALSRQNGALAAEIRSSDVEVNDNAVNDVPNWEGIDSHGGQRLKFTDNTVTNCKVGIQVGPSVGAGGGAEFAPLDVTVTDNTVDSGVADGSAGAGIMFTGASGPGVGQTVEYATGAVSGNNVRGHGEQANSLNGGVYLHTTRGLVVSGNDIIEPSPVGIALYHDNQGFVVSGNTITDPWSETPVTGWAASVIVRSDYNEGLIGPNATVRGTKAATYVCLTPVRVESAAANTRIVQVPGFSQAAGPQVGGIGNSEFATPNIKHSFYGVVPIVRPAANPDTSGATLVALETEVNQVKATLRALGLLT